MLLFVLLSLLSISQLQPSVDKRELAAFRHANCPYRDIIGCTDFMCFDFCRNPYETYQIHLKYVNHQFDDWNIFKKYNYEKNYPFPQESTTCPF